MAGMLYNRGEVKIRPGVYFRSTNIGEPQPSGVPTGISAAVFRATWGPLGVANEVNSLGQISDLYGDTTGPEVAKEQIRAGVLATKAVRVGTGGVVATATLVDTTTGAALSAVRMDARYVGTRGNALQHQIRDNVSDTTLRDYLIFELVGTTLIQRQSVQFAKGALGVGEPQALVDALNAIGSKWVVPTKLADGNKLLATFGPTALTGGTDPPAPTGADYTTALGVIESTPDWYTLATDSEDTTVHASVASFIQRIRNTGKFTIGFVGEPSTVLLATRLTNARTFNAPYLVYVGNGFRWSDGIVRDGARAAARLSGFGAALPITRGLTHFVVDGGIEVIGELSGANIDAAINAGMLVFSTNALRQVQVEYGITTFTTPTADLDAGWKKIRRTRVRDNLMLRIAAALDPVVGSVTNDADGRSTLISIATGVGRQMIAEGALRSYKCLLDPAQPPAGDTAYFVSEIVDLDSMDHIYLQFGWQFGGQ